MIRVVITGAECTGKTSLAAALSGYYGEPWTAEYVRQYVSALDRELEREDLEPIAEGQLAAEEHALGFAHRLILHDTNLLSSILYANHYFGEQLDWANACFLSRDYALYLLCSPKGIEWRADPGQRESAAARAELHKIFKDSLGRLDLPYVELTGNQESRFGEALLAINKLLKK